jgi:hypothetical protein
LAGWRDGIASAWSTVQDRFAFLLCSFDDFAIHMFNRMVAVALSASLGMAVLVPSRKL